MNEIRIEGRASGGYDVYINGVWVGNASTAVDAVRLIDSIKDSRRAKTEVGELHELQKVGI